MPPLPPQKAQGPDQAPKSVARLGVPHLRRRHVRGDRKMLVAGVSRFHPDPMAAIEEARRNVRFQG